MQGGLGGGGEVQRRKTRFFASGNRGNARNPRTGYGRGPLGFTMPQNETPNTRSEFTPLIRNIMWHGTRNPLEYKAVLGSSVSRKTSSCSALCRQSNGEIPGIVS